jgi:malate dehydrogenase
MLAMKTPIRVAVTGAAGQIGYALCFRLASGEVFGPDQGVILQMVEIPQAMKALDGLRMELEDCAFATLAGMEVADSEHCEQGFTGANWVILLGGIPRKAGMERSDLIRVNGPLFTTQGKAVQTSAADDVRVLVVANPCNTNCLIAMSAAPDVPRERWFAMTRLDQNRAAAQLALKSNTPVGQVKRVAIWGNHSATQYPDFQNATIGGRPATEVIGHHEWLRKDFISIVQKRGAAVIDARGASSAASASNAALDTVKSLIRPTPKEDCISAGVCSDGSYGIEEGLICGFPLKSDGKSWSIIEGFKLDEFARSKIEISVNELKQERETVKDLLD